MRQILPLALQLLHYAAGAPRMRLAPCADHAQLQWVMEGGLGPLLHAAVRDGWTEVPEAWHERLVAADLTASIRHDAIRRAAADVLDACARHGVAVTLLKGVALSESCYPVAHWRPMGDVDVLIEAQDCPAVEADLRGRGYRPLSGFRPEPGDCHGVPLRDPRHGVWVEIHWALFPAGSRLSAAATFHPRRLRQRSRHASCLDRPVLRLPPELELLYIAAAWVRDLSRAKSHPAFLPRLFDAVFLLKTCGEAFDWTRIEEWRDNPLAVASLHLLLHYLVEQGCARLPESVLPALLAGQRLITPVERALLERAIDRHLVAGRPERLYQTWHLWDNLMKPGHWSVKLLELPWKIAFPPSRPGRYRAGRQFERLGRMLRRRSA